jgi:hypothetical protein
MIADIIEAHTINSKVATYINILIHVKPYKVDINITPLYR